MLPLYVEDGHCRYFFYHYYDQHTTHSDRPVAGKVAVGDRDDLPLLVADEGVGAVGVGRVASPEGSMLVAGGPPDGVTGAHVQFVLTLQEHVFMVGLLANETCRMQHSGTLDERQH